MSKSPTVAAPAPIPVPIAIAVPIEVEMPQPAPTEGTLHKPVVKRKTKQLKLRRKETNKTSYLEDESSENAGSRLAAIYRRQRMAYAQR